MKNSQSIRKILFLSNTSIVLVVFDIIDGQKNILFAEQVALNGAEIRAVINDLLAKSANFLGFNIKEVEIVFDDPEVKKITCKNEFHDCCNEDEITKEVYKKAKVDNLYVNEINYTNIIYDDIEKKVIVDYELVANVYTKYGKFVKAAKECNLTILNLTNLYTLINNNKASNQIVIRLFGKSTTVSEYALGKLNNIIDFELGLDEVYKALSDKFDKPVEDIKQIINIINNIDANLDTQTLVSLSFDFVHKKFAGIKANEFIASYQEEVNYLLSNKFDLNGYSEVTLITNEAINKLTNAKIVQTEEIIGLENIDTDKLLALSNVDINAKANSQFKFENTINSKIHSLVA